MSCVVHRRAAVVVTLASFLLSASPAWAQADAERAAARAAATQGVEATEAGRYAEAIELFNRAESIVHAPPHLLYIARAEAKLGKLVAAHETYIKITREALPPSAPRAFVDAQTSAQQELAELKPRLPSLTIIVDGGVGKVTMDGKPLPDALVGIARPTDPGRHELRATGHKLASAPRVVELTEGAHETVHLTLQPAAGAEDERDAEPAKPADADPGPARRSNLPAYLAWGVGAAGLVVGTTMMVVNRGKRADAEDICPPGQCPQSRKAEVDALDADADSAATMSWVGYGVGVLGLGVGTVLYVMNRKTASRERARAGVTPWVGLGGAGLTGRF